MKYQQLVELLRADEEDAVIAEELMALANGPANDVHTHRIATALRMDLERFNKDGADVKPESRGVPRSLQRKIVKLREIAQSTPDSERVAAAFLQQIDRWAAPGL